MADGESVNAIMLTEDPTFKVDYCARRIRDELFEGETQILAFRAIVSDIKLLKSADRLR